MSHPIKSLKMESIKKQFIPTVCEDILIDEILPRLPTKSVIRFKSVSKTWLSRISQHSSLIAAKHSAEEEPVTIVVAYHPAVNEIRDRIFFLDHSVSNMVEIDTSYLWKKTPDPTTGSCFKLIGSCNGLVCIQLFYPDNWTLVLWNPATREVNHLPAAPVTPGYDERCAVYVLGFDNQTGDHKVVRLEEVDTDQTYLVKVNAQIFSRKSGHWRAAASLIKRRDAKMSLEEGLVVEGVIYWAETKFNPFNVYFNTFTVMWFDVSKEEFGEFDGPPLELDLNFHPLELVKWKGALGAIWVRADRSGSRFWLKNQGSGNGNLGWTEISTMDPSLWPLTSSRLCRYGILFKDRIPLSDAKSEILYNLLTTDGTKVEGPLQNLYYSAVCHHFHSLVSPN